MLVAGRRSGQPQRKGWGAIRHRPRQPLSRWARGAGARARYATSDSVFALPARRRRGGSKEWGGTITISMRMGVVNGGRVVGLCRAGCICAATGLRNRA